MLELVNTENLQKLESLVEKSGSPLISMLQPGLSPDEQDTVAGELGVELSDEARTWWSWTNGVEGSRESVPSEKKLGSIIFMPLRDAVDSTRAEREADRDSSIDDELFFWSPGRLKFALWEQSSIVCEIGVPAGAPSPVRLFDWGFSDPPFEPKFASMGDLVDFWIEVLEVGILSYDKSKANWFVSEPKRGFLDDWLGFI